MSPFHILFLLFLLVPIAEIYLLIEVGSVIGAFPTIALVVLTAVAGAALMRAQGMSTLAKVQNAMGAGEVPAVALLESVFILVAGALLLMPGFVTDTIGFLCLIPPLRVTLIQGLLSRQLAAHGAIRAAGGRSAHGTGARGQVIEGEIERDGPL